MQLALTVGVFYLYTSMEINRAFQRSKFHAFMSK